jgi:hypothetical protein
MVQCADVVTAGVGSEQLPVISDALACSECGGNPTPTNTSFKQF